MKVYQSKKQVIKAFLRCKGTVKARDIYFTCNCYSDALFDNSLSNWYEIARIYNSTTLLIKRNAYSLIQQILLYYLRRYATKYGYTIIEVTNFCSETDSSLFQKHIHISNLKYYESILDSLLTTYIKYPLLSGETAIHKRISLIKTYLTTFYPNYLPYEPYFGHIQGLVTKPLDYLQDKGVTPNILQIKETNILDEYLSDIIHIYDMYLKVQRRNFRNIVEEVYTLRVLYYRVKTLSSKLHLYSNPNLFYQLLSNYPELNAVITALKYTPESTIQRLNFTKFEIQLSERLIIKHREILLSDFRVFKLNYHHLLCDILIFRYNDYYYETNLGWVLSTHDFNLLYELAVKVISNEHYKLNSKYYISKRLFVNRIEGSCIYINGIETNVSEILKVKNI